jgi:hypothetical protein
VIAFSVLCVRFNSISVGVFDMCTLHVYNNSDSSVRYVNVVQIADDWRYNSDGASVLFMDEKQRIYFRGQFTRLGDLLKCLKQSKAVTILVHLRASTTDTTGVSGCHMFDSPNGNWIYAHNGIISNADAAKCRVDSLVVGPVLDKHDGNQLSDGTTDLPDLSHWSFANLICVHVKTGKILIHKSAGGKLSHDGNGNWSTYSINRDYTDIYAAGWYDINGEQLVKYAAIPRYIGFYHGFQLSKWYGEKWTTHTQQPYQYGNYGSAFGVCDFCLRSLFADSLIVGPSGRSYCSSCNLLANDGSKGKTADELWDDQIVDDIDDDSTDDDADVMLMDGSQTVVCSSCDELCWTEECQIWNGLTVCLDCLPDDATPDDNNEIDSGWNLSDSGV